MNKIEKYLGEAKPIVSKKQMAKEVKDAENYMKKAKQGLTALNTLRSQLRIMDEMVGGTDMPKDIYNHINTAYEAGMSAIVNAKPILKEYTRISKEME
jgi:hypothetical protein